MVGIPSTVGTDAEDVAWALQTADALWKRNERNDAIVWLRRAAQAAGEAEDDDRALALARHAAELTEWVAQNPLPLGSPSFRPDSGGAGDPPSPARRTSRPPPSSARGDGVSVEISVDVALDDSPRPPTAPPPPRGIRPPPPRPGPPPPPSHAAQPRPSKPDESFPPAPPIRVQSAAEAHAGMLDPWAEEPTAPRARPPSSPPPIAPTGRATNPAIPTVKRLISGGPPAARPASPSPAPPRRNSSPAQPAAPATRARASSQAAVPAATPPPLRVTPRPPPLPVPVPVPSVVPAPSRPPPPVAEALTPPAPEHFREEAPTNPRDMAAALPSSSRPTPVPKTPVPPPGPRPPTGGVDLSQVESLSDLPDDARDEFAEAATVHQLARDEEVSGFALAVVLDGAVSLSATMVDAPARRLEVGTVMRSRGTIEASTPVRLVGATDRAAVATWDERAVAAAFRACPWVETELRSAGDRLQAEVGLTMGPLGEGLDLSLRADMAGRMKLRVLAEQEELAARGKPVPGLVIVGAGELETVDEAGDPTGDVLHAGEFLFPSSVLGGAPAPSSVRAAKGGAVVLVAERGVAQELLVTCPPLLEILAG